MRNGKLHGDKGEVSVHLSPRNPVTLNSTFIRFVNRPRGKVLGADQRAELRSREEVQIRPQSARDFVWKWSGGCGGGGRLPCGKEASPFSQLGPALACSAQLGAAAPPARRARSSRGARPAPGAAAGPGPVSRPIRRFVPARAAGGPSASPGWAEGPR